MNNYYFDASEDVNECIRKVIINENIAVTSDFSNIVYTEDEYEDGIRQFTVEVFDVPLAIMSILENVIEDKIIINYQKISRNGE